MRKAADRAIEIAISRWTPAHPGVPTYLANPSAGGQFVATFNRTGQGWCGEWSGAELVCGAVGEIFGFGCGVRGLRALA
jgi:hypothetical protein